MTTELDIPVQRLPGLNDQQSAFVTHVLHGMDMKEACLKVGYALGTTGDVPMNLRKHPIVHRYLTTGRAYLSRATGITKDTVLEGMLDAVDAAETSQDLTRAWSEIGKIVGAYKQEVEVSVKFEDVTEQKVGGMSDAELIRLIQATAPKDIEGTFEVVDAGAG